MATAAWRDSCGPGGRVERVRSWVAGSASGQRGDVEGGPPRASQLSGAPRQKNAVETRKGRSDRGGVRVTPPGDGCMVHKSEKAAIRW